MELIDNEIENEFEIVPESANGSTGDKTVPELAIGKTEEKKVPAELVISKTEEKIVPEPASGNNADKTVPKPASNVDKTVPEPAKTVPEPAIAKNEDETVVPVFHTVGLWGHGIHKKTFRNNHGLRTRDKSIFQNITNVFATLADGLNGL